MSNRGYAPATGSISWTGYSIGPCKKYPRRFEQAIIRFSRAKKSIDPHQEIYYLPIESVTVLQDSSDSTIGKYPDFGDFRISFPRIVIPDRNIQASIERPLSGTSIKLGIRLCLWTDLIDEPDRNRPLIYSVSSVRSYADEDSETHINYSLTASLIDSTEPVWFREILAFNAVRQSVGEVWLASAYGRKK